MNHFGRIISTALCILFLLFSTSSQAQSPSEYVITSGSKTLTFVPRPDLGFVFQSNGNGLKTEAFGGMLSSVEPADSRNVRGLNERNLTVLLNDFSDNSHTEAFKALQSQNHVGYASPLFSVNEQIVSIIPEIVVRLAFTDAYDSLQTVCNNLGLTIKQKLEFTQKEYLLEVAGIDADSVFTAVEKLNKELFIEWAMPNIASQPILFDFTSDEEETGKIIPNDEYFSKQWHLYNTGQTGGTAGSDINTTLAWKITTGDPNIIIAVIDTGVDINHPDLIDNLVPGYDFFDDDNTPAPFLDDPLGAHGTMCAGLVAAKGNNNIGVCGVAWNCKIMPIRIADSEDFITDADIATAFRWAAENGADVLSNSWGSYYSSQVIYSAIRDVTKLNGIGRDGKGCVVCAAAGNWEDGGPVGYPAAHSEVLAVGATDHDDGVWYYSASGPELDIVAPSGAMTRVDHFFSGKAYLWTTDIIGLYGYSIENIDTTMLDYSDTMAGTSGACPLAAGVAALVLSIDPNLTNIEVRRILLDSAVDLGKPGMDENYGYGRVDANSAVTLALNPPTTPATSYITLFVDDNAPDDPCAGNPEFSDPNEDGTSMHPFDSIQEAVDFALYSETIFVLAGTYTGAGNCNIDLSGKALKLKSESGPESCIIDCQESGQGFIFQSNESLETQIEGFTITNGKAYDGAGIFCSDGSSPTITNCIIENCWAYSWGELGGNGGAIYIGGGNPVVTDCTFTNNMASWNGGGIYNFYGNPNIENCSIIGNMAGYWGGGMYNESGQPTIIDCIFKSNSAATYGGGFYNEWGYPILTGCTFIENKAIEYDGGGIYNDYGDPMISNCSFIDNSAGDWAGAFCNYGSYDAILANCIFNGNTADSAGGAMYNEESFASITNCTFASNNAAHGKAIACDSYSWYGYGSMLTITNCIIWDGSDSIWNNDNSLIEVAYSDIMKSGNSVWPGEGNINKDPEFADPNNGDYHLKSQAGRWEPVSQTWVLDDITSPCIDAGDPASDFTSEPQPNGARINMGFYGGTSVASLSSSEYTPPSHDYGTKAYNPNPADIGYFSDI
ncbi:MAG: S8 family serine peptidase [Sedimentisphaerales bacterium]|nr:S8 family serine peptidase [Sedimentisphaerales bacterium]